MTDHDPSTGTAALTLAGLPRARRDQALLHLGQSWPERAADDVAGVAA